MYRVMMPFWSISGTARHETVRDVGESAWTVRDCGKLDGAVGQTCRNGKSHKVSKN